MRYPIFFHHGHGAISTESLLGLLISVNLIMFIIYVVVALNFLYRKYVKKDDDLNTFFYHVIWADYEFTATSVTTMFFVIVNGMALIVWMADYISKML